MWLDSLDDLDSWEVSAQTRETSEQQKEKKDSYKKWLAGIQRTQKDEKKAKKDNDFLFKIVSKILENEKYDILLPFIVELLEIGTPSNFILWGLSLVYEPAVEIIRNNYSGKEWLISSNSNSPLPTGEGLGVRDNKLTFNYQKTAELIEFSEENLDKILRNRINEWIEDIYKVVSNDPSTIISNRFLSLTLDKEKIKFINFLSSLLTFFFYDLNIVIQKNTAFNYSQFILWEIIKKVSRLELEEI